MTFAGTRQGDGPRLTDNAIHKESTFELALRLGGGMLIFVKGLTARAPTFNVDKTAAVKTKYWTKRISCRTSSG